MPRADRRRLSAEGDGAGGRRAPALGLGAAGLALLAALSDEAVDDIIGANASALPGFGGLDAAKLRSGVAQARRDGYGLSTGLMTPGASGIGLVISSDVGPPHAALSVAAVAARMAEPPRSELSALLRREIGTIARASERTS